MSAWSFPVRAGQLIELDTLECRRLLASGAVGRLGYNAPGGSRIVPVNYTLLPDAVVFRTTVTGEIAEHGLGRPVAFEVDDVDLFLRSGWSVLVTAELVELSGDAVRLLSVQETGQPWASGDRSLFCSVSLTGVTGRRVLAG